MPSHVGPVFTEGHRVALLGLDDDIIYIWNFGGRLREIDLTSPPSVMQPQHPSPDPGTPRQRVGGVIMHPHMENVLFVALFASTGDSPNSDPVSGGAAPGHAVLQIHEFNGKTRTAIYTLDRFPNLTIDIQSRGPFNKVNAFGLYGVASGWNQDSSKRSFSCVHTGSVGFPCLALVTFNVFTKEFDVQCHHIPTSGPVTKDEWSRDRTVAWAFWNDQCNLWMTCVVDRIDEMSREAYGLPILTTRDCRIAALSATMSTPLYTTSRPSKAMGFNNEVIPLQRRRLEFAGGLRLLHLLGRAEFEPYGWQFNRSVTRLGLLDENQEPSGDRQQLGWSVIYALDSLGSFIEPMEQQDIDQYPVVDFNETVAVAGDDDFLLFFHENGYTVWSFWTGLPCRARV